jgi:hypothetical protein
MIGVFFLKKICKILGFERERERKTDTVGKEKNNTS